MEEPKREEYGSVEAYYADMRRYFAQFEDDIPDDDSFEEVHNEVVDLTADEELSEESDQEMEDHNNQVQYSIVFNAY